MDVRKLCTRIQNRLHRDLASILFTRSVKMCNTAPLMSFTFDDFPRSALHTGGAILREHGICATYYASLGLMGQRSPVGEVFTREDLEGLLAGGHELGCHTFAHCHSWKTRPSEFERSIVENRRAIAELLPGTAFRTFSFPLAYPRPSTKRRAAKHFRCCRCGGQTFNANVADLNLLNCYFLEKGRDNPEAVKRLIERNGQAAGWLILVTHDVCESPSPFGCTPAFFRSVVREAVASGARILPVDKAREAMVGQSS